LDETRARTLSLLRGLDPARLRLPAHQALGPILWDLGHLAVYEDRWAVGAVLGARHRLTGSELERLYDAFEQPRPGRAQLELLPLESALALQRAVRERTLEGLEHPDRTCDPRLLDRNFVQRLIAEHEVQHAETMLQALSCFGCAPLDWSRAAGRGGPAGADEARVGYEGGSVRLGRPTPAGGPFDNEGPPHRRELDPFALDALPVSNRRFTDFVLADGYRRREFWTPEGWRWRERADVSTPLGWRRIEQGEFVREHFGQLAPLHPAAPVEHISAHEAEAFARFAGGRLPSEAEWEHAAQRSRCDVRPGPGLRLGPEPLPDPDASGSAFHGWVYQWTADEFRAYPGFRAFPYPEYSTPFLARGFRVLRGSSWASWPYLSRSTYRNWDHPDRRQLFAGVRLAWDL
jgi:iron(II)-dependent oxidoreductase